VECFVFGHRCRHVGVVSLVAVPGDSATSVDNIRGLAKQQPAIAFGLTLLLLAQAGVPLTSGFVAKFGVIQSAVNSGSYVLAIATMGPAVIAAFLYLRIMVSMWLQEPANDLANDPALRVPIASGLAIGCTVAFTLVIGLFPERLLDTARDLAQFASRSFGPQLAARGRN